jgi:hypothetical protein
MEMKNTMPWDEFLTLVGMEDIEILKGSGRRYAYTPAGTVYFGDKTDTSKTIYVGVANFTSNKGTDLTGSIWAFNSKSQVVETLGKQRK